jgi:hypothetical protein
MIEVEEKEELVVEPVVEIAEPKTPKNFRSNPDIENFYRFVHETGLRRQAGMVFETALKQLVKKGRRSS